MSDNKYPEWVDRHGLRPEYDALCAELRAAQTWQPLEDGEYKDADGYDIDVADNGDSLRCYVTGGYEVLLPPTLRLCRRADAGAVQPAPQGECHQ